VLAELNKIERFYYRELSNFLGRYVAAVLFLLRSLYAHVIRLRMPNNILLLTRYMGTDVGKVIFNKIGKLYRIQTNLNKLRAS